MSLPKHKDDGIRRIEWPGTFPSVRWLDELFRDDDGVGVIKVEEFTEDGTLVIRAELPGFDPDKDVTVTVDNGMLHIVAERQTEETDEDRHFHRRELRYGSFARTVALPEGADGSAIKASAKDGILEVRVPMPEPTPAEPSHQVPIEHTP
jgi:HSP20 family protein